MHDLTLLGDVETEILRGRWDASDRWSLARMRPMLAGPIILEKRIVAVCIPRVYAHVLFGLVQRASYIAYLDFGNFVVSHGETEESEGPFHVSKEQEYEDMAPYFEWEEFQGAYAPETAVIYSYVSAVTIKRTVRLLHENEALRWRPWREATAEEVHDLVGRDLLFDECGSGWRGARTYDPDFYEKFTARIDAAFANKEEE